MKRIIIVLCAVLVISALILSGCSNNGTTTGTSTTSAAKTIELRFATFIPPNDVYHYCFMCSPGYICSYS